MLRTYFTVSNGDLMEACKGYLLSDRVIVPDYTCANNIYWNGYYGTFLGVPKPKRRDINAPLELSLLEATYLAEKDAILIVRGDTVISPERLASIAEENMPRFRELYSVYKDLRARGFVVRRGLKFGCDFLIYRYGPGIDHAPYGVHVYAIDEKVDPIEIVRMGRVIHSVRKNLIIAIYDNRDNTITYLLFKWWKP